VAEVQKDYFSKYLLAMLEQSEEILEVSSDLTHCLVVTDRRLLCKTSTLSELPFPQTRLAAVDWEKGAAVLY
jgi:hypothetical protein